MTAGHTVPALRMRQGLALLCGAGALTVLIDEDLSPNVHDAGGAGEPPTDGPGAPPSS